MKIVDLINELIKIQTNLGNIELYTEYNDGRSTSAYKFNSIKIVHREIWPKHPDGKKYFIEF